MEFAVIETGGKQYKVAPNASIKVELMGDLKEGDKVAFDKVIFVTDGTNVNIGTPYIKGAKVNGVVESLGRNKKITVIHYKAKSRYFKKNGHRQQFVKVKISSVK
jgi:large subunit ribosomal protein L21